MTAHQKAEAPVEAASRKKSKDEQILVARASFVAEIDGKPLTVIARQTRVLASHPLVASRPDAFVPVDESLTYGVETATRAPGEKRGG